MSFYIFNPLKNDPLGKFRGAGRIIQIIKENFPKAKFIDDSNQLKSYCLKNKSHQDEIVFLNPVFNPFQPPAVFKRLARKQIQIIFDVIPLKYKNHFPSGFRGKINLYLNRLALKNYDKIVTISNYSKNDINHYLKIPQEKIEVVYPTVSKKFLNLNKKNFGAWNLELNDFCLYVGDVNWNKNLVNLAKAIKIINITCVFVGKAFEGFSNLSHPWQEEFRKFLTEVKNDKRFIFLGYVDDYQLIKLYKQARVNILISRDEGFGFSFLEAAFCRCPSVLSDIPVFHEIAKDSCWFADPNDPYDIANKIGEIYFNKKLRDQLGLKALERAKLFKPSLFKKRLESLI